MDVGGQELMTGLGALAGAVAMLVAAHLRKLVRTESRERTTAEQETLQLLQQMAEQQNVIYEELVGRTKPWLIERDAQGRVIAVRPRPPRPRGRRDGE